MLPLTLPPNPPSGGCPYIEHQDLDYIYQGILAISGGGTIVLSGLNGANPPSPTNCLIGSGFASLALANTAMIAACGANQISSQNIFQSTDGMYNYSCTIIAP